LQYGASSPAKKLPRFFAAELYFEEVYGSAGFFSDDRYIGENHVRMFKVMIGLLPG